MLLKARQINDFGPNGGTEITDVHQFEIDVSVPPIACMGLAFQPDIGDLRESGRYYFPVANQEAKCLSLSPTFRNINFTLTD